MKAKFLATLGLVLVCGGVVITARHFLLSKAKFTLDERALLRSKGEPQAPVWITEYIDYQCGGCKVASEIIGDYFKVNPSGTYVQVRFFPLSMHLYGLKSVIFSECAARQGKFWKFHDALFEKQSEWSGVSVEQIDSVFEGYARTAGLNSKALQSCVENPKTKEEIFEESQDAKSAGVKSTPTFFINGKMVVGVEELKEELKKYLK